jgi:hypothetical protein
MNKKFSIQFILGIIVTLIAASIMFEGRILGENTTGYATIVGIIGIGIIGSSHIWSMKK